jgi:hypothetical protein
LGHVGNVVVPPGTDTYAHLAAFVGRLQEGDTCSEPAGDFFGGVTLLSDAETFHKASEMLVGRTPTVAEEEGLAQAASLSAYVKDTLLSQPAFYRRLQDLYNDLMLTDRKMGNFKLLAHLAQADYPNRF